MSVARKHRSASAGEQTIGSPRTLKLVFTSTGQPVFRFKRLEQPVKPPVPLFVHRLHAARCNPHG